MVRWTRLVHKEDTYAILRTTRANEVCQAVRRMEDGVSQGEDNMKIDWRDDLATHLKLNLQQALQLKNKLIFIKQMVTDLESGGRFGSCKYCKRIVAFRGHKEGCVLLGYKD